MFYFFQKPGTDTLKNLSHLLNFFIIIRSTSFIRMWNSVGKYDAAGRKKILSVIISGIYYIIKRIF